MIFKHSLSLGLLMTASLFAGLAFAEDGLEPYDEAPPPTLKAQPTPEVSSSGKKDAPQLMAEIPPQELLFDLKIGEKLVGSVPVTYTDSWVEINDIDIVIEQLNAAKNPESFRGLLTGKIETATPRDETDIGQVTVDPNQFLISMTIAKESLIKQELDTSIQEFKPYDKWVFANAFRATGNTDFQSDTDDRFALDHTTTFGEGRWFIESRGFLPKDETYQASDLTFNYHFNHSTLKFGMLETVGQNFAFSRNFLGFGLSSELQAYEDLRNLRGSRIELYVPSRAQVDIYRGNRILYSRILDFGLQEIDTSRFPSGSYGVRAVITETDGTETEESFNFSKFLEISPRGKPEYNVQVGISRDGNLGIGTTPVYQAEVKWRLLDNFQAEMDIYGGKGLNFFEPTLTYYLDNDNRFENSMTYSSAGDAAVNFDFYGKGFKETDSWTMSYSNAFKGFNYDEALYTEDDFETFVSRQQERFNVSYNSRFGDKVKLSLSAAYSDNGQEQIYNYGPRLRFDIFKDRVHTLYSDSRLTMSGGDSSFFTGLTYRRTARPWRLETTLGRGRTKNNAFWKQRNMISYDNTAANGRGTYVQVTNDNDQQNGSLESRNDLIVRHQTDKTALRAFARNAVGGNYDNSDNRAAGLELTTSMLITEEGKTARLPKLSTRGMAVIDIIGDSTIEAEFDVLINNVARARGKIGESVPINLTPYKTYTINLVPVKGADLIKVENKKEVISILPGNIAKLEWRVDKSILLIGRLLDIGGKPLAWKTIRGIDTFTTTDGFGNFQIELSSRNQPFVNLKEKGTCTLAVPELTFGDFYINIGDMVCV